MHRICPQFNLPIRDIAGDPWHAVLAAYAQHDRVWGLPVGELREDLVSETRRILDRAVEGWYP